jgi:hypothetical protein
MDSGLITVDNKKADSPALQLGGISSEYVDKVLDSQAKPEISSLPLPPVCPGR